MGDLLESFLKHSTSWSKDKIWHKIFEANSQNNILPIILSLFNDLLLMRLDINNMNKINPPPLSLNDDDEEEVTSTSHNIQLPQTGDNDIGTELQNDADD